MHIKTELNKKDINEITDKTKGLRITLTSDPCSRRLHTKTHQAPSLRHHVDACAVWWERESFYCLPRISVVTWHREPRFQCGSARTCSIWNSSIEWTLHKLLCSASLFSLVSALQYKNVIYKTGNRVVFHRIMMGLCGKYRKKRLGFKFFVLLKMTTKVIHFKQHKIHDTLQCRQVQLFTRVK